MVKKINNWIGSLAYIYLTLPILIFVIGWIKLPIAVISAILIIIALFCCIKNERNTYEEFWTKNDIVKFGIIFCIISLWVYLSGIGGLCYQNNDHYVRNRIFRVLVEYDWPTLSADGNRLLIYYIGFWLPAAVVGKVFGMTIGYWFQAIWSVIGIFFTYYFICMRRKKIAYWPLILFILFSGMDYLGILLLGREAVNLLKPEHIEWWAEEYQYSSMTTQLFWVYNQAIPAWMGTILLLCQKNKKNLFFILSLLILSSTFCFVGLIPVVLCFALGKRKEKHNIKENFSIQNVIGVLVIGIISVAYLMSNAQVVKSFTNGQITQETQNVQEMQTTQTSADLDAVADTGTIETDVQNVVQNKDTDFSAELLRYLLFIFIEFMPYVILVSKGNKSEKLFYVVVGILLVCPLIRLGDSYDFTMRASIPALFCLMIYCIDFLTKEAKDSNNKLLIFMVVIMLIGSITPLHEIHRSIQNTIIYSENGLEYTLAGENVERIFENRYHSGGTEGNLFMKYFAKNNGNE